MASHLTHRLSPMIGAGRLVGLTFAVIAPISSIFLTYGTAYRASGIGIVFGFAAGALINLAVMCCYAELGSRYPEAGGDYALAARSLGRWAGSLYTVIFAVKGIAIPALLALSAGAYLHELWRPIPTVALGMMIFLVYVVLAGLDLKTSSTLVTAMVAVEVLVLILFALVALTHLRHPVIGLLPALHRPGRFMGALAAALYGLNGPQACLYYSEEATATPRQVGRTIFGAALVTVLVEVGGVLLGTLALPHWGTTKEALPLAALIIASLGPWARIFVLAAIAVALFDTGLATTMSYVRIFFAIARDGQWPGPLNRIMRWISSKGVPWGALAVLALANLAMMALSGIYALVTLGGSLLIVIYLGIIAGTVANRIRALPPYVMPSWPWPVLVGTAGLLAASLTLTRYHIVVTSLVVLLGLAWAWAAPRSG
jgi:amino acid transporter